MGLFEDARNSGMCGAECMCVCVFMICCEILWNCDCNFESH